MWKILFCILFCPFTLTSGQVNWTAVYQNEPCGGVPDSLCPLILGGHGEMWGEHVDISDLEATVWPKLAAIAEKVRCNALKEFTCYAQLIFFQCLLILHFSCFVLCPSRLIAAARLILIFNSDLLLIYYYYLESSCGRLVPSPPPSEPWIRRFRASSASAVCSTRAAFERRRSIWPMRARRRYIRVAATSRLVDNGMIFIGYLMWMTLCGWNDDVMRHATPSSLWKL